MFRKKRFKIGQRVNAFSLDGKKILGEYRGARGSFGVYVYGLEVGQTEPKLHICRVLDMEPVKETYAQKYGIKQVPIQAGDPVRGYCQKLGKWIVGAYMNSEGRKFVWIRGWIANTSKLEPKQAFKCLKTSLQSVE